MAATEAGGTHLLEGILVLRIFPAFSKIHGEKHFCRYPNHEQIVGHIAREMGFTHVSLSSQTMPMVRIVPRGYTGRVSSIHSF